MLIRDVIKKSVKKISGIIFPSLCIHCKCETKENFFCADCLNFFELIEDNENDLIISCFEPSAPINTFVTEAKKMSLLALPKVAASYMVCQYFNFALPLPNLIVPIPDEKRGVQANFILAKELSLLLKKPVKRLFPAGFMNFFYPQSSLKDKSILLVGYDLEKTKIRGLIEKLNDNFHVVGSLLLVKPE